jgi:hypothetical protein
MYVLSYKFCCETLKVCKVIKQCAHLTAAYQTEFPTFEPHPQSALQWNLPSQIWMCWATKFDVKQWCVCLWWYQAAFKLRKHWQYRSKYTTCYYFPDHLCSYRGHSMSSEPNFPPFWTWPSRIFFKFGSSHVSLQTVKNLNFLIFMNCTFQVTVNWKQQKLSFFGSCTVKIKWLLQL